MPKAKTGDFAAFAATHPRTKPGVPCSICAGVPAELLREIGQAWDDGHRSGVIMGYLRSKGFDTSRNRLDNHFRSEHHHGRR